MCESCRPESQVVALQRLAILFLGQSLWAKVWANLWAKFLGQSDHRISESDVELLTRSPRSVSRGQTTANVFAMQFAEVN